MQLGYRFLHVLRRMLPIAMFLLQRDGQFLNGHDMFLKRVGASYHAFLEDAERACRGKCLEDLQSTTRYVTWSLHTKSRASLKSMLNRVSLPRDPSVYDSSVVGKPSPQGLFLPERAAPRDDIKALLFEGA